MSTESFSSSPALSFGWNSLIGCSVPYATNMASNRSTFWRWIRCERASTVCSYLAPALCKNVCPMSTESRGVMIYGQTIFRQGILPSLEIQQELVRKRTYIQQSTSCTCESQVQNKWLVIQQPEIFMSSLSVESTAWEQFRPNGYSQAS